MNDSDYLNFNADIQSAPSIRPRLFCFPYVGMGISTFRSWSHDLQAHVDIYPILLPGREQRFREPPFTRLVPLVEILAEELMPYMIPPFALFGHSMGALISFELTRLLRRYHYPLPTQLFLSGHPAVHREQKQPPVHALPDSEFIEKLSISYGIQPEIRADPALMRLLLPALRADIELCETYAYTDEMPLECPITVFGGLEDTLVSSDDLEAWREQTREAFALYMLPGNHLFIKSEHAFVMSILLKHLL